MQAAERQRFFSLWGSRLEAAVRRMFPDRHETVNSSRRCACSGIYDPHSVYKIDCFGSWFNSVSDKVCRYSRYRYCSLRQWMFIGSRARLASLKMFLMSWGGGGGCEIKKRWMCLSLFESQFWNWFVVSNFWGTIGPEKINWRDFNICLSPFGSYQQQNEPINGLSMA